MTAPLHPTGQPLAIFTPAFEAIIRARIDQQARHGHSLDQDVTTGAHALVRMAYNANLKSQQQLAQDAARHQQEVLDQTMGHTDALTDRDIAVAYARLAKSAALIIAAMDVLDAMAADRRAKDAAE